MQAGNLFQGIPNIYNKLYFLPGGILVDSIALFFVETGMGASKT